MTDQTPKTVRVFGITPENATHLLAAAEDLEQDPGVVRTTSLDYFLVPEDVATKAGVEFVEDDDYAAQRQAEVNPHLAEQEADTKKTAAKKTAAKRAAAKPDDTERE